MLQIIKSRNILWWEETRDVLEKERYLLDKQEQDVKHYCAECGRELYDGDIAFYDNNDSLYIHEECLEDYVQNFNLYKKMIGDDYYGY